MKRCSKIFILMGLILFICLGCNNNFNDSSVSTFFESKLEVNYIDVGQGDSIFIELPNNKTMLIDAGESYMSNRVIKYINNLGYSKIDYVIGTHPHTDHIGGLESVINSFYVGNIYLPKAVSTTKTYEDLLTTISNKGLKINTAKSGVIIEDKDNLKLEFIAPNSGSYDNLNNYSAVVKLSYFNNSFLFMGDAEIVSEDEIINNNINIKADVIKVGHHGSDSSSSLDFVKRVSPDYAIIMVGKDNSYNHPYQVILDRYSSVGSKIFRTDLDGNIVCNSDGNKVSCNGDKKSNELGGENINNIKLVSLTSPVKKGDNATIGIKGLPNTTYDIDVMYSSGESKAKGLFDKISNSEGIVNWTFKVSSNVKPGIYDIIISDDNNSVTYSMEVVN